MDTNDLIEIMSQDVFTTQKESLAGFLDFMKSPIEKLFFLNSLYLFEVFYQCHPEKLKFNYNYNEELRMMRTILYSYEIWIYPQFSCDKYITIDFLYYVPKYNTKIAIECDGHEFHEKTKKQVIRDKQRDRWLNKNGYIVFRYSGSEIYNDKMRENINMELYDILEKIIRGEY